MNKRWIIVDINSKNFVELTGRKSVVASDENMSDCAKKARMEKITFQVKQKKFFEEEEGPLHGAAIAD